MAYTIKAAPGDKIIKITICSGKFLSRTFLHSYSHRYEYHFDFKSIIDGWFSAEVQLYTTFR